MSREKLMQTKALLSQVFIHEPYYIDATLACFASRAHICLLGFRGGGKTHLMESLIKMVDPNITAIQQGYLSAELEDVFARPDISSLMRGEEKVVWKKMTTARVKGFDEIQRLGVGALSAMFRLMTSGSIMYLDKEQGVKEFWLIATANPTEVGDDALNIRLPEPLWDRFDAVLWVPIAKLKHLRKINGQIEKLKEALPTIWTEKDLLKMWREVDEIKVDEDVELTITLICKIMGYCKYAQDYDASSLTEEQKRELCSKCTKTYTCSQIARPPSVRAKMSLIRVAKGFAYLRGSDKVELIDVEKAFPIVMWKRIKLMEDGVANRLDAMKILYKMLMQEITEVKEGMELRKELWNNFDEDKYRKLKMFADSKGWFNEIVEELDDHYESLKEKLMEKFNNGDEVTKAKIYFIAKKKLPYHLAKQFYFEKLMIIELNPKTLARLVNIDRELFNKAKMLYERGEKEMVLIGEEALLITAMGGIDK